MLDKFLEVASTRSKVAQAQDRQVQLLKKLPDETLMKIAMGKEALGFIGGDHDHTWLDKFKGTALFEQALELEQESLEQSMEEKQGWREEDQMRAARTAKRDELCIRKKMLELDLAKEEAGMSDEARDSMEEELGEESAEAAAPEEEEGEAAPAPEVKEAAARMREKVAVLGPLVDVANLGLPSGTGTATRRGSPSASSSGAKRRRALSLQMLLPACVPSSRLCRRRPCSVS
jgi:hypothetical protein